MKRFNSKIALIAISLLMVSLILTAQEPPLPTGLQSATASSEPPLPTGLGSSKTKSSEPALPLGLAPATTTSSEPPLPTGLSSATTQATIKQPTGWELPTDLSGFWETRGGTRLQKDPHQKAASIGETRLQLRYEPSAEKIALKLGGDLLYDPVLNRHKVDLYRGRGFFDLRQANLLLRPIEFMDITIGRQINTWGTGDMLFINDMFPKDWNSYFIGRDDEYLKAPSDSVKASFFSDLANLDLIYSPRFNSDRYIDGRRISYWNSGLGRRAGRNAVVNPELPDDYFRDDEWATRLYRNIGSYEVAAYGYDGYWKSPGGSDPERGKAIFPRLQVVGGSTRGPLGSGIINLESGWYRSHDNISGKNPFINNSEMRYLVGYEQELARDFTGGVQYYVEQMLNYSNYKRYLPPGMRKADEFRQVVTLRLTKLLMNQNLQIGTFFYFSPTDLDTFMRPKVSYKIDDHWIAEIGGNIFVGKDHHTFFGQFDRNSNIYASLRYGF